MNFVEMMTERDALTENGAITNSTSHNYCVDLFFLAGACRNEDTENIQSSIEKAYEQDRLKTLKIIFWAGDIRQGAGERRFFKLALDWLNKNHPEDIQNNIQLVPEFSRWDVIFDLANENKLVFSYIASVLAQKEHPQYNLLCKWLPRKATVTDKRTKVEKSGNSETKIVTKKHRSLYGGLANRLRKSLNLTPKQYRKMLVEGTKVVETQMCNKEWDKIDYSKIPSVAMNKYNKAWYRNDEERFNKYIEDVKEGKSKINASAIFPHDIIKEAVMQDTTLNEAKIVQWNNLPNYLGDTPNNIIPVCDVSGSMYGLPLQISVALGLYISERNLGPFKDAFITFSGTPKMNILHGNLNKRLDTLKEAEWGNNTNIQAVFELILSRAKQVNLDPVLMPKSILIISDMEFDSATSSGGYYGYQYGYVYFEKQSQSFDGSIYDKVKQLYNQSGYQCPNIIFWNVNGRVGNVPITVNDLGVALISGASPSVIKSVLSGDINPVQVMNRTIETERYSVVK